MINFKFFCELCYRSQTKFYEIIKKRIIQTVSQNLNSKIVFYYIEATLFIDFDNLEMKRNIGFSCNTHGS